MPKIVFTGGGTAGHITPNLALIELLKNKAELHYCGSNGMEKTLLAKYPYVTFHQLPAVKLYRRNRLKNILLPLKLLKSVYAARKTLAKIKPDVVFSKGGYVALPTVLAAKCPVIAHESDFSLGLANKLIANKCAYLCASFPTAIEGRKNGFYSGAIIREEIYHGNASPKTRPVLLVMGGSQGATVINHAVESAIDSLLKTYDVIHLTGKGNMTKIALPGYTQIEYSDNINDLYATADIVVTRGGSNSLFELLALGKRTVVIPLPKGNSRGDQEQNARFFADKSLVVLLEQSRLNKTSLEKAIIDASNLPRPIFDADGSRKVADLILKTANSDNK